LRERYILTNTITPITLNIHFQIIAISLLSNAILHKSSDLCLRHIHLDKMDSHQAHDLTCICIVHFSEHRLLTPPSIAICDVTMDRLSQETCSGKCTGKQFACGRCECYCVPISGWPNL